METMPGPERRRSAAAEGRAADFSFAHETMAIDAEESAAALDQQIQELKQAKQRGREHLASITNEKLRTIAVDAAEKSEQDIDVRIAELELEKQKLVSGEKSALN